MRRLGFNALQANLLSIPNVVITVVALIGVTALSEIVDNRWLVCTIENWFATPQHLKSPTDGSSGGSYRCSLLCASSQTWALGNTLPSQRCCSAIPMCTPSKSRGLLAIAGMYAPAQYLLRLSVQNDFHATVAHPLYIVQHVRPSIGHYRCQRLCAVSQLALLLGKR